MYAENVKRGIEWLDANVKGWRAKIDIGWLNLSDDYDCVLGQIFGNYDDAIDCFGLDDLDDVDFRIHLGFTIDSDEFDLDEYDEQFKLLTNEWKKQLAVPNE